MDAPSTASGMRSHATQSVVLQAYGGAYSSGGFVESHVIPMPFLCGGKGSSFLGLVRPSDRVKSELVVGMKLVIPVW